MKYLLPLIIVACLSSVAFGGQTRRYITRQVGPQVSYYVDITPRPTPSRGFSGMLKPPHNTMFDGPRTHAYRMGPSTSASQTYTGSASTHRGYSTPVSGTPQLIINPFVDQTNYKGLGE